MESIFEDGYLKQEFINPNYRGNWDCDIFIYSTESLDHKKQQWRCASLLAISGDFVFAAIVGKMAGEHDLKDTKIKQFSLEKIPVGEWCWVGRIQKQIDCRGGGYIDRSYIKWTPEVHSFINNVPNKDYVVPYLIAETKEDAERLKDWAIL